MANKLPYWFAKYFTNARAICRSDNRLPNISADHLTDSIAHSLSYSGSDRRGFSITVALSHDVPKRFPNQHANVVSNFKS